MGRTMQNLVEANDFQRPNQVSDIGGNSNLLKTVSIWWEYLKTGSLKDVLDFWELHVGAIDQSNSKARGVLLHALRKD